MRAFRAMLHIGREAGEEHGVSVPERPTEENATWRLKEKETGRW